MIRQPGHLDKPVVPRHFVAVEAFTDPEPVEVGQKLHVYCQVVGVAGRVAKWFHVWKSIRLPGFRSRMRRVRLRLRASSAVSSM